MHPIYFLAAHLLIGNLPWIVHVFRYMARGTKRQKAHEVLQGTAIQLVQQRRKDNNPAKVSTMQSQFSKGIVWGYDSLMNAHTHTFPVFEAYLHNNVFAHGTVTN